MERLTGKALLSKLEQLKNLSRDEQAKACGYTISLDSGAERAAVKAFLDQLAIALGYTSSKSISESSSGLSYFVKVQASGLVSIPRVAIEQLRLEPGEKVEIKYSRNRLILSAPTKQEDEEMEVEEKSPRNGKKALAGVR